MKPPLEAVPRAIRVIQEGIQDGLHVGAQVYVTLRGDIVTDFGIGEARDGLPMTSDTIMLWLSACKPVAAVAIAQLWEQGKLDLDLPVAAIIPEFGTKGKDHMTLRHLLTHTAGFRTQGIDWKRMSWDEIVALICEASTELNWVPGWRARYHFQSSWYILGEVVRRLSGLSYSDYVRERIFMPLGMNDCWIGMSREQYHKYSDRMGVIHKAGHRIKPRPNPDDNEDAAAAGYPGSGGYGPMKELARLYETLYFRGERYGVRLLHPITIEALTARHRAGMVDETFNHIVDWGLGFIINSNAYGMTSVPYGYGFHASPRTFGHGGRQSSAAFCDPDYGLVVAVIFNGTPNEARHSRRIRQFCTALYEDLGLDAVARPPQETNEPEF